MENTKPSHTTPPLVPTLTKPNHTKLLIINYKLPLTNCQLQMANYQLPITNCQLPITKWPNNHISISSQFSYEFDSIELHSCYQLTFKTTISILALQSIDFLERVVLIFSPCEPWHFQIRQLSGVVLKDLKDILKANLRVKYQKIFRWVGEES